MNSLKQVIVSAIVKVSTDPMYAVREYATSEDARADFIKALIAELFPECPDCVLPSAVQASEGGGAVAEPVKEKKKRAPKKEKEPVVVEEKKDEPVVVAEPEKKKAGRKPKAAAVEAVAEEPKEKKKPGPKPKAKVEGPVNLEKLNPTQTKKLKSIADELKVDVDKKAFHEYINALPKEEYDGKTFDDHARAFLTPTIPSAPEEPVLTKCAHVEWQGETYLVDPETQKVYAPRGNVNEHVGHVGMLEFAGLEIPAA